MIKIGLVKLAGPVLVFLGGSPPVAKKELAIYWMTNVDDSLDPPQNKCMQAYLEAGITYQTSINMREIIAIGECNRCK